MRVLEVLDRSLNIVATGISALFIPIGLLSWKLVGLTPFQASFYFGQHQAIHDSSIIIFCTAFLFARWFWGLKAFWMIGLMWGMSELGFNGYVLLLSPSTVEAYFSPIWDAYILFVILLFVASAWRLRKSIHLWPAALLYISFLVATMLYLLVPINIPVYGTYGTSIWELFWDGSIILSVLGVVKRVEK